MGHLPFVNWNPEHAEQARSTLKAAVDALEYFADWRLYEGGVARQDWEGPYRRDFDEHIRRTVAEAYDLAGRFRAMMHRISDYNDRAKRENDRRAREAYISGALPTDNGRASPRDIYMHR